MTARKLFFKRIIDDWKFQWGVIHSVLDWTIILYFLIPSLIVLSTVYTEMWRHIGWYWNSNIPYTLLITIIVILSSRGNFRTYLKEADLLHIIQQRKLIYGLKLYSFYSSFSRLILELFIIFILILPILKLNYRISPFEIGLLFLSISAYQMTVLTLKKVIDRTFIKWILWFISIVGAVFLIKNINLMVAGLMGLIINLFLIWLNHTKLLASKKFFLKEIEIEDKERLKYIKIILNFSMAVEKENRSRGKKPYFLFRNSKRLFKNRNKLNGLTEILIKSFLRSRRNLTSYFQIVLVTTSAIIVLPVWIKWLVFIGFVIFINFWLRALFKKMLMSDFFAVVLVDMDTFNLACARSRIFISLPFIFLIGAILIVKMFL